MANFHKDLIDQWKNDLLDAVEGEQIYIVSGEGNYNLFANIGNELRGSVKKSKKPIRMIAGPVISVENSTTKDNPIFGLVEEGVIDLYISPYRQLCHYRIIGLRKMYKENYHEALSFNRVGNYIDNKLIISKYIHDFETIIVCLELPKYNNNNPKLVARLTSQNIEELKEFYGRNYDFSPI
jgi:hypothetical protein